MQMLLRVATAAVVLWTATSTAAQPCDTSEPCTAGMCQDGECVGVPLDSGACDDGNACTVNDTCVSGECRGTAADGAACDDFNECTTDDVCILGFCLGTTPVQSGTRCASGCGTCQRFAPSGEPPGCVMDPETLFDACTPADAEGLGPCFVGRCVPLDLPPLQRAFCAPRLKTCPDDGDLCTGERCNRGTGACESAPLPLRADCLPAECHRCVPGTGQCEPDHVGASCDDANVCTASTVCSAAGQCVAGAPPPTVTPTPTEGANMPTATPTRPPCVGDCDNNDRVDVHELITSVNIALERAAFDTCSEIDRNGNQAAEVNELVSAVNSSIRGCGGVSAALR